MAVTLQNGFQQQNSYNVLIGVVCVYIYTHIICIYIFIYIYICMTLYIYIYIYIFAIESKRDLKNLFDKCTPI